MSMSKYASKKDYDEAMRKENETVESLACLPAGSPASVATAEYWKELARGLLIRAHRAEERLSDPTLVWPKALKPAWHDSPVDMEHEPADLAEAIEMLKRAKKALSARPEEKPKLRRWTMWLSGDGLNPKEDENGAYVLYSDLSASSPQKPTSCWKCGRQFTKGEQECTQSPCGAIVDRDGNVTAGISYTRQSL